MSKKKNKKHLHGIEHLYQDITPETSISEYNYDEKINKGVTSNNSYLSRELLVITIIMVILFGILGIILYLDRTSDFLEIFAEKLTNFN